MGIGQKADCLFSENRDTKKGFMKASIRHDQVVSVLNYRVRTMQSDAA